MLIFEPVDRFHGIWFGCCTISGHSNIMPFNSIQYIIPTWRIRAFFWCGNDNDVTCHRVIKLCVVEHLWEWCRFFVAIIFVWNKKWRQHETCVWITGWWWKLLSCWILNWIIIIAAYLVWNFVCEPAIAEITAVKNFAFVSDKFCVIDEIWTK